MRRSIGENQLRLSMPSYDRIKIPVAEPFDTKSEAATDLMKDILFYPNGEYICLNEQLRQHVEICKQFIDKNQHVMLNHFDVLVVKRTDMEDNSITQSYVINHKQTNQQSSYYDAETVDREELIKYAKVLELLTEYVQTRRLLSK